MVREKPTYEEFEARIVNAESRLQALLDGRVDVIKDAETVRPARLAVTQPSLEEAMEGPARASADPRNEIDYREWARRALTNHHDHGEAKVDKHPRALPRRNTHAQAERRERIRAVEAPRAHDERFKIFFNAKTFLDNVINAMPNPVFVKNERHEWLIVNDAFCHLMGSSREELVGKSDGDFVPGEEADLSREKDNLVFHAGGTHENEEVLTDSDGAPHAILTRKTAMIDDAGGKVLIGVITELRLENTDLGISRDEESSQANSVRRPE